MRRMAKMRFDERTPHPSAKSAAAGRQALSRLYGATSLTPDAQVRQTGQFAAGLATPRGRRLAGRALLLLGGFVVVFVVVAFALSR